MAYSLANSIIEVRSLINEASAGFWTDAQITEWIAQGCLDWSEKTLLYKLFDTVSVVTNTTSYTTSGSSYIDNAIRTLHAEYDGKAMKRATYEEIRKHTARDLSVSSEATPTYYYDSYNGSTFTFYIGPTPSATENGNNISVIFACRTDDITEVPDEYQPTIFLYAAHKAKIKDRQYQEASLIYQQYINHITFARKDSLEHGQHNVDSFRTK